MTEFSLRSNPAVLAALDGAKGDKRATKYAEFSALFGPTQDALKTEHVAILAERAAVEAVNKLTADCVTRELSKVPMALVKRAAALGVTLMVKVTDSDPETGEPIKAVLAVQTATTTSGKGKKGSRWTYKLDGKLFLSYQLPDGPAKEKAPRSIKAQLVAMADKGDAGAKQALEIHTNPHKADANRWGTETNLNCWQAAQAVPVLAARLTRDR